jgi:predicted DNA binding protein
MTATEVLLKARHESALLDLTALHPSMRIYTWCNRVNEITEVEVSDPMEYEEVRRELGRAATILGESGEGGIHIVENTCFCNKRNSVAVNIEDLPILMVQPEVMRRGWDYYRLILFRHEDFAEVVSRLEFQGFTVDVLKKTEIMGSLSGFILEADSIFSSLTGKQMDALMRAYTHGYYKLPRGADIQEIAKVEKVKRTTFQEHLKKGENKIIDSIIPYMRLYSGKPRGEAV